MRPTTVLLATMLIDVLALMVSITYQDLFNVICFGIILMGMLFYYMEHPR
jgi:hypothetical protein